MGQVEIQDPCQPRYSRRASTSAGSVLSAWCCTARPCEIDGKPIPFAVESRVKFDRVFFLVLLARRVGGGGCAGILDHSIALKISSRRINPGRAIVRFSKVLAFFHPELLEARAKSIPQDQLAMTTPGPSTLVALPRINTQHRGHPDTWYCLLANSV